MLQSKALVRTSSSKYKYIVVLKYAFSFAYFAAFLYLVFFAKRRRHQTEYFLNIIPFKNTFKGLLNIHYSVNREIFSFYSNVAGNIVLFIPFSIISILVFRMHKRVHIILLAFSVSFLVELLQYILRIGVADIDDIILNVLGALTGIAIFNISNKAAFNFKSNKHP